MGATEPANISIVLRNLLLWPLLAFAVGVPINTLAPFAAFLVCVLFLLFAAPRFGKRRWMAAGCFLVIGSGSLLASPPVIEEGMNGFLPGYPQTEALRKDLPEVFFSKGMVLFDATYPTERRCDPDPLPLACWRSTKGRPTGPRFERAYAFSADGLWSDAKYSRQVTSVDFQNIAQLRAGFVNDAYYRWYTDRSEIPRSWLPYVVRYDVPESYRGSELCWTGLLMLQDGRGLHDKSGESSQCMTLALDAGPVVIYGLAIKAGDLALRITPPLRIRAWVTGLKAARIAATLLVLLILFKARVIPLALALMGVIASLVLIDRYDPEQHVFAYPFGDSRDVEAFAVSAPSFQTYRLLPPDLDGFQFSSFGRSILWDTAHGYFREALVGTEAIFYYMPGMRYLEALSLAVFGDSEFGPIFFASLTTICLFYFIATFTSRSAATILCAAFLFAPKAITQPFLFDFTVWLHIYLGHWGDGDAVLAFLIGVAIMIRVAEGRIAPRLGALMAPGMLMSAAVFIRPNFAAAGAAATLCCLWQLRRVLPIGRLAIFTACFGFPLLATLHNWAFANVFYLFTSSLDVDMVAPPRDWAKTLAGALGFGMEGVGEAYASVSRQLTFWLGDLVWAPDLKADFIWLRVAGLVLLPAFLFVPRLRTFANMTLLAITVAAQLPLLFFLNTGRYGLIAWPCTMIAMVLVLQEGLAAGIGGFRRWRSTRAVPSRPRPWRNARSRPA